MDEEGQEGDAYNFIQETKLDKKTSDNVQQEYFPDSFLKEFSADTEHVQEELHDMDEPPLDDQHFAVLAASAGRGVAELLVDPVFHGWVKSLRIYIRVYARMEN